MNDKRLQSCFGSWEQKPNIVTKDAPIALKQGNYKGFRSGQELVQRLKYIPGKVALIICKKHTVASKLQCTFQLGTFLYQAE